MRVVKAVPIENASAIASRGFVGGLIGALHKRRNAFWTKTNKGRVVDVRQTIAFAFNDKNQSFTKVPRGVVFAYDFDPDRDEFIFASGNTCSSKTYYYQEFKQEWVTDDSELLLVSVANDRLTIPENITVSGLTAQDAPKMDDALGPIYRVLYCFFEGFDFGVHGLRVSPYPFMGDRSLKFMKRCNAQGWQVYLKPKRENEPWFVLFDDIDRKKVSDIVANRPFLFIKTSWDKYQLWVRCIRPLMVHEKVALIKKYHADPKAHPNNRWGRAPSFLNRKREYEKDGKYPWCSLLYFRLTRSGGVCKCSEKK